MTYLQVSDGPAVRGPDLASLTGMRSSKSSYYREYRRSSERLESTLRSLDQISVAVVRTAEGPRALLTAVVQAAAAHLQAQWVVLAVADDALPQARPRFLGVDACGQLSDVEDEFDPQAREWLGILRSSTPEEPRADDAGLVVVPMTIDGIPVGGIAGLASDPELTEPLDLSVLRILVNQAAVALHSASLYHSSRALRTRADQLTAEASRHAHDLAIRNEELRSAQELLNAAQQREALDAERHRIARELHDSVTQYVLSAGMIVDVASSELNSRGDELDDIAERLRGARDLTQHAVGQLRSAIYALNRVPERQDPQLPRLLERACQLHSRPGLLVELRLEGSPVALPAGGDQSLATLVGEALFNVSSHSGATRAVVRLSYQHNEIRLTIDDDGTGNPAALRTQLSVASAVDLDGSHRGLVNMASRAQELGGVFRLRRSRLGGLRTLVEVPIRKEESAWQQIRR
ncbi:sensor histidine kinase [Mycolicibacterium sp. CH28]|uniref:MadS family sensor histidine kinase n=1 Tax=Mycolicibacterium sp. CH28 TaxID=2512237 RepID=UPI001F15EE3C|nr:histidine kinase [Mycolicibacterium sp. CH28]